MHHWHVRELTQATWPVVKAKEHTILHVFIMFFQVF